MPVLKREPDVFPNDIFDLQSPWLVAHLKSRQEKLFARHLRDHGVPFYLPQSEKRVKRNGRTIVSYLPLFPGYAFFRGTHAESDVALRTHLVVNLLSPNDQAQFDGELRQLHDLQMANGRLIPYPEIVPGDPVEITEGVFAGYRGVVLREKNSERLIVSVSFIHQSVMVDLDREAVRPDASAAYTEI